MFFGKIITKDQPFKFVESENPEESHEVLSVTNVTLAPSSKVCFIFTSGRS